MKQRKIHAPAWLYGGHSVCTKKVVIKCVKDWGGVTCKRCLRIKREKEEVDWGTNKQ